MGTDLRDAWVGALDILTGQVQPAGGVGIDGWAVVPQGALSLSAAPAALELPLRLQTHAAAVSLGCTLVQVHCGIQEVNIRELLGAFKQQNAAKFNSIITNNAYFKIQLYTHPHALHRKDNI